MNNNDLIQKVSTSGDMRQFIIEVMMGVRDGKFTATDAQAMIAGMKEINASMQVEINAAKLSLQADQAGHKLGKRMKDVAEDKRSIFPTMGQRSIVGSYTDK